MTASKPKSSSIRAIVSKTTFFKFSTLTNIVILVIILFTAFCWFSNILQFNLNPDEIAWIYDSRFFQYYLHADWSKFELLDHFPAQGWQDPKFRLTDQPQTGKYLIGLFLTLGNKTSVFSEDLTRFGNNYPQGPDKLLNLVQSQNFLGDSYFQAISLIRIISSLAGFLTLLIFFYTVARATQNKFVGLIAFLLVANNLVIKYNYRLATTDVYLGLFFLLSLAIFWKLTQQLSNHLSRSTIFLSVTLGITSALTATIKLNGFFLIFLPMTIPSVLTIYAHFHRSPLPQGRAIIAMTLCFFVSFISVFYLIEPEIWGHPLKGLATLLISRQLQQNYFYNSFNQVSISETPLYYLLRFYPQFNSSLFVIIKYLLVVLGIISLCWQSRKHFNYFLLSYLFIFIFITNAYYGRVVGIDRYLIPSFFVLSVIIGLGIQYLFKHLLLIFKPSI